MKKYLFLIMTHKHTPDSVIVYISGIKVLGWNHNLTLVPSTGYAVDFAR